MRISKILEYIFSLKTTVNLQAIVKPDVLQAKTISIRLGAGYFAFGGFGLLMSIAQSLFIDSFAGQIDSSQANFCITLNKIWAIHLPLLMMLGVFYFLFGYILPILGRIKFVVSIGLLLLSLAWAISYVLRMAPLVNSFVLSIPVHAVRCYSYISGALGFSFVFALLTLPQIIIHIKMKTLTQRNV
jgi:hypothetical protein